MVSFITVGVSSQSESTFQICGTNFCTLSLSRVFRCDNNVVQLSHRVICLAIGNGKLYFVMNLFAKEADGV